MKTKIVSKAQIETSKKLGVILRNRRMKLGLSQSIIGDQLKITFQQVQKYERGVNRLSVPMLLEIAKALACTPADIIEEIDETIVPVNKPSRKLMHAYSIVEGFNEPQLLAFMKFAAAVTMQEAA